MNEKQILEDLLINTRKNTERLIRIESRVTAANNANMISSVKNDDTIKTQINIVYINNKYFIKLNHLDIRICDLINFINEQNLIGEFNILVGDNLLCQITI